MLLEDAEFSQVAEDLKKAVATAAADKEGSSTAPGASSTNEGQHNKVGSKLNWT